MTRTEIHGMWIVTGKGLPAVTIVVALGGADWHRDLLPRVRNAIRTLTHSPAHFSGWRHASTGSLKDPEHHIFSEDQDELYRLFSERKFDAIVLSADRKNYSFLPKKT